MQNPVSHYTIDAEQAGQRIDNYLVKRTKGVPKSRIYRAIRQGEVRVNKKRVKAEYKLQAGDVVRIPPLRVADPQAPATIPHALQQQVANSILYEDKQILVINKPAGVAVHGGSGIRFGLIEVLRQLRPRDKFLDLVHRLDRQTSGCLVIAKKSTILKQLHEQFRAKSVDKRYLLLVQGDCDFKRKVVDDPLTSGILQSGERMVRPSRDGKAAVTTFRVLKRLEGATLLEAQPLTGRMHQIRVHAQILGHPIVGDDKYGDASVDKTLYQTLRIEKRLYLHCASLRFGCEGMVRDIAIGAVLDDAFKDIMGQP